jgi:hypothetical protein
VTPSASYLPCSIPASPLQVRRPHERARHSFSAWKFIDLKSSLQHFPRTCSLVKRKHWTLKSSYLSLKSYFIHVRYCGPPHSLTRFEKATRRPHLRGCGYGYFESYIIRFKLPLRLSSVRAASAAIESAAARALVAVTLRKRSAR